MWGAGTLRPALRHERGSVANSFLQKWSPTAGKLAFLSAWRRAHNVLTGIGGSCPIPATLAWGRDTPPLSALSLPRLLPRSTSELELHTGDSRLNGTIY